MTLRVTFCAHDRRGYVGGPNVWLVRLARALKTRGVDLRVLILRLSAAAGDLECALREAGVACESLRGPLHARPVIRWLLADLERHPADVFVPNTVLHAYYAARAISERGIPAVGVIHSDDEYHHGLLEEFGGACPEWNVSAFVVVSRALEELAAPVTGRGVAVRRIPYIVPIPERRASPAGDVFRLVYTGRYVEEQKRISDVARAFARITRELPNVEAVLHGVGPAREAVLRILSEEGTGRSRDGGRLGSEAVQDMLLRSHAIMLLSDYEGLPISLMEAMACGVVPVCKDIRSGIPELIRDGETGLLVRDTTDGPVTAIRRLLDEPGLWQRLSDGARRLIEAEYSEDICAGEWLRLLEQLHAGAPPSPGIAGSRPASIPLPPKNPKLRREDFRSYLSPDFVMAFLNSRLRDRN
ncbi:glycosyltransferase family 4 protein [Candidatus Poribacteria bacterium]|nr:glycosyltransferase family 4 protein [Candidatus Poribacteria bacterium]